jgi:hypothetical protein
MKKICVIVAYFGEWPSIFPMFLDSIKRNRSIDFLFITGNDDEVLRGAPNIRILKVSLQELSKNFSSVLNLPISIGRPYKLCDFRPMFGHLFAEYVRAYDFWGHCDVDLVFGDIRSFISDDILRGYEKILPRGNFSLYRNTDLINGLYQTKMQDMDWRDIAMSDCNFAFDEWPGIVKILKCKGIPIFMDEIVLDINPLRHDLRRTIPDNVYPQVMYYEKGRVFRWRYGAGTPDEFCLIHLQKRKLNAPKFDISAHERIYFTPTGFLASGVDAVSFREMEAINGRSLIHDATLFAQRGHKFISKLARKGVGRLLGR